MPLTGGLYCAKLVVQEGRFFMKALNISEARNTLPALVESVASTRTPVVLLKYGKPAAMLVPIKTAPPQSNPYPLRGKPIIVAEDFDEPLSPLWEACGVAEATVSGEPQKTRVSDKKGKRKKT